ncbi:cytochrome c1 [Candidatus Nucleicultrix amoebiphila]|jgi:ubiquinol-cytochrome c reductase cytochrome c1 subunit|uniref:Cytochrome c1 n=1 Tax=Candidatus Nucleicultrix amoebiphila FS5 TaxID=1414854 RepID=A0A1W6N4C4_9PROT|nr:cytochrome c1 [Candidatus Nucleicultrix amoebiphila]ARN84672.1 cytochrome C [Candidatus Nucleicultrix amoebiphila FS5]
MKLRAVFLTLLFCGISSFVRGEGHTPPPKNDWSFKSPIGTFDRAALQRGFQVYKEVCSTCHSMNLVSYRNLRDLGFSHGEVKAIAKQYQVPTLNDEGESITRPAESQDAFVSPYPNEKAARAANNGAYPPDLSLIVKARNGGADYVKALLVGFKEPPAGVTLNPGMHYNVYFQGNQIAMAEPLKEGLVTYTDGTKATVEQMADDVVTFLSWAAEPEMEARKRLGIKVLIYLSVFSVMMYFALRRVRRHIK